MEQLQRIYVQIDATHYLFAFYIFLLLGAVALLCKVLFSDIRRQHKLLDEKENKLLKLYTALEDAVEEFYDNVESSKGEVDLSMRKIREELRASARGDVPAGETDPAAEGRTRGPEQRAEQEAPADFHALLREAEREAPCAYSRNDSVIRLYDSGRSPLEIAKELGITRNEVDLVIGINKKNSGG